MSLDQAIALLGVLASTAAAVVAYVGLSALGKQVAQGVESLKHSSFATVLNLEQSISNARSKLADVEYQLGKFGASLSIPPTDAERLLLGLEEVRRAEAVEHYLNLVDRLAACIIRGLVDEEQYRRDYRQTFQELITARSSEFTAGTRHGNIVDVHTAWSKDESARRR